MNPVFCNRPFKKISNQIGQQYFCCCYFRRNPKDNLETPADTLPIDVFTGDLFTQMRRDMLSGEKTEFLENYCGFCHKREKELGFSPRLYFQDFPSELAELFGTDGKYKGGDHRHLELNLNIFGNYCNLQCYECIPTNSSGRVSVYEKLDEKWSKIPGGPTKVDKKTLAVESDIKKVDPDWYAKILENVFDYAHNIETVSFSGGEPALMKSHFDILDGLILSGQSKEINLQYTSNMTVMSLAVLKKYIDNFKSTTIFWSIDGLDKQNSWLRYPTNWETMMVNVKEVRKYLEKHGLGRIHATMTPSLFGMMDFYKFCRWLFLGRFIPDLVNISIANEIDDRSILHPRHLPNDLKEQISDSILKLSPPLYKSMWKERDEEKFQLALQYATELDNSRGTNWKEVFPALVPYIK